MLVLPTAAADWARENGIVQLPPATGPVVSGMGAISSPNSGTSVRGEVAIAGSAQASSFVRYSLDFGSGVTPTSWSPIGPPKTQQVNNSTLGVWDTRGLADGVYTLRLTVQDSQRSDVLSLPVTVDNRAPSVRVTYPSTDSTLLRGETETIGLQAEVQDNAGVDRVEFFVNGTSLGFTSVAPYNRIWRLALGQHVVYAVATDKAGNSAQSQPVVVGVQ
jgi:hypothetical protein